MPDRAYPSGLLPETKDALDMLTDDEIAELTIWYDERTSEFAYVGFVGPGGKVTKWADERRALAIAQMEKQMRWEATHALD